jgi:hypothetical protein
MNDRIKVRCCVALVLAVLGLFGVSVAQPAGADMTKVVFAQFKWEVPDKSAAKSNQAP